MSSTITPRSPPVFGNVCYITANGRSNSHSCIDDDNEEVTQQRRPRLRHMVSSVLRRCSSTLRHREPSADEPCPLSSDCTCEQRINRTPSTASRSHHRPSIQVYQSYESATLATAMTSSSASKSHSTTPSTSSALSNTEAWKLSLALPFVNDTPL